MSITIKTMVSKQQSHAESAVFKQRRQVASRCLPVYHQHLVDCRISPTSSPSKKRTPNTGKIRTLLTCGTVGLWAAEAGHLPRGALWRCGHAGDPVDDGDLAVRAVVSDARVLRVVEEDRAVWMEFAMVIPAGRL